MDEVSDRYDKNETFLENMKWMKCQTDMLNKIFLQNMKFCLTEMVGE